MRHVSQLLFSSDDFKAMKGGQLFTVDAGGQQLVIGYDGVKVKREPMVNGADKSFACDRCDKTFQSSNLLGMHKARFHRKTPAEVVGEAAAIDAAARERARKHRYNVARRTGKWPTGPHKCDRCPRSFANRLGLGMHRKMAHGIRGSQYQKQVRR